MSQLPDDVVKFLLENPPEVERLQRHIVAVEANRKWHEELAEKRRRAPMVPCGAFGCTKLRNTMDTLCSDCMKEYKEDPDDFK